jgi:hypothetical protein
LLVTACFLGHTWQSRAHVMSSIGLEPVDGSSWQPSLVRESVPARWPRPEAGDNVGHRSW